MRVTLEYGKTGLAVTLPADRLVAPPLAIADAPPLPDAPAAIADAIRNPIGTAPLADLAAGKRTACILICDITRPVPNSVILPELTRTLEAAAVPRAGITILNATGLHRPNEGAELVELVGEFIATNYRCLNHRGKVLHEHDYLGTTPNGVPMWIDNRYTTAELKLATGLIEPHFMAGYSGGRKLICPGVAALETVRRWHSPRFLTHPNADSDRVAGNPVHDENTFVAKAAGCDFIVNVCIDGRRRVTWVGAGDMVAAWEAGVRFCRGAVRAGVPEPVDVVVTSGAGYPLDTTWYQAVKALVGALPIVKKGGTIVLAAGMTEGVGSPEFYELLKEYAAKGLFHTPTTVRPNTRPHDTCEMDEWQIVMLQKALAYARVKVVTAAPLADVLRLCTVEPAPSVEQAVAESLAEYGPAAKLAVIPKGPYVLPYVIGASSS